ncbi:MAG: Macrolide export ATP-binding/permease protein MacB [Verrucomicrobiota bacterium]|jgi:putative ABC transport system permease protein
MTLSQRVNEWTEAVAIAGRQILAHKVRSLLTALGVIIGIVAVTLMGTAIKGIDTGFTNSLDMLGQDTMYLQKWPWGDVGDDWFKYRNRPNVDIRDADRINEAIAANPDSLLRLAVPSKGRDFRVKRDDRSASGVYTEGTVADFASMSTADPVHGRFFTHIEDQSAAMVAILGYDLAESLFPEGMERAIGERISIHGYKFTVIGVLERQGSFLGLMSFDRRAIVPLRSLQKFYRANWGDNIKVAAKPDVDMDAAEDELTGIYRRLRGLGPDEENDFELNRSAMVEEQLGPVKSGVALAGFFVTGLALFVGAIGIMNITFVSVKERTREIGTRRAIGARRQAILLQFLMEAVSICLIGGLIGLLIAFGLQSVVSTAFPDFPFSFSADLVILATTLSIFTGVASGLAPAWQAARLDPAIALRHE